MTDDLKERLRERQATAGFYSPKPGVIRAVYRDDTLTTEALAYITDLEARLAAAEAELAAANNEFGSETASWPGLWKRIAQLKELSNERWQRAEAAEAGQAAQPVAHVDGRSYRKKPVVVKGVKGEFYPCKPDIFAATYDPANQPTAPVVPAEGLANRRAYQVGYAAGQAAALRSAPPVGARVRPLEWHRIGTFGGDCYDASATGVVYRIVPKADGTFWLTAPSTTTATLEAAKAAAQADYEARILAALLPAVESP